MTSSEHCSRAAMNVRTRREIARRQPDCFIPSVFWAARLFKGGGKKRERVFLLPPCNLSRITRDEFPSVQKRETRSLKVTSVLSFKSPDPPIYSIPLVREHSIYLVQYGSGHPTRFDSVFPTLARPTSIGLQDSQLMTHRVFAMGARRLASARALACN